MDREKQAIRTTYKAAHEAIDMVLTWMDCTPYQRQKLTNAINAIESGNKALDDVRVVKCINGMCFG